MPLTGFDAINDDIFKTAIAFRQAEVAAESQPDLPNQSDRPDSPDLPESSSLSDVGLSNVSSNSPLLTQWDTEVLQPASLATALNGFQDIEGDEYRCGRCSTIFLSMYDFLSHRSLNESNTPSLGDTETPHIDPPSVSVLKRKENSLMSAKSKAKKQREAYRGFGFGKRDDQQPDPPITGQLFTISAPKTCADMLCL